MPNTEISKDSVKAHGLTPDEYQKILKLLGRTPNLTELGVFFVDMGLQIGNYIPNL